MVGEKPYLQLENSMIRSICTEAAEKFCNRRWIFAVRLAINKRNNFLAVSLHKVCWGPFALHDMLNTVDDEGFASSPDLLKFRKIEASTMHPVYLGWGIKWGKVNLDAAAVTKFHPVHHEG
jgi:hypothetical protein